MLGLKRVLIVSPHFPPSTLAGVHRARHLAKHLPHHGWKPTVICVDPRHHVEALDHELTSLIPAELKIVPSTALPVELTRPFGVAGDIGLRGYFGLRAAVEREMAAERVDAVLITGSPYYPMLMAKRIRQRWKVPVILDFQDPWVSRAGASLRRMSKGGVAHQIALALEPLAVRNASVITSVSQQQNVELASRYPWLDQTRMAAIPIGGDPDDFNALRSTSSRSPHLAPGVINISYAGTIWPPVVPTLEAILRAVARLRNASLLPRDVRLNFVGTTANPNDRTGQRVSPLAKDIGVESIVYEVPERRPYLEALKLMAQSDINLMIGSDEPHYTASKIYPGLMSGRPFLSVFHRQSSAHDVLTRAQGGVSIAFESVAELPTLVPSIAEGLVRLIKRPDSVGQIDPAAYASYTGYAVAGQFAEIFRRVVLESR